MMHTNSAPAVPGAILRKRPRLETFLRAAFCVVAACLIGFSLVRAVTATHQCVWPSEWDLLRDIGTAQMILDGRYPEDPILPGETLWYNPLTGALLAAAHRLSGIPLPRLGILLGPWLNLITPLGMVALLACLFGRAAALAGLCMVLYGKYPPNPFWLEISYAPWLMAPLYASGLMFLTLAAYYKGTTRRSPGMLMFSGALLGVTFMAHTAPAIIAGGTMLLHTAMEAARMLWKPGIEHEDLTGKRLSGGAEAVRIAARFALLLLTAFLVSLPYTWSILWNYGFHVRNPHPSLFTADFLLLVNLPIRLHEAINWRNAFAVLGVFTLLRRRDSAALLVLGWTATACLLMTQHYLWQWLLLRGVSLTGLAPGHHWAVHLTAVRAVLFAVGVTAAGAGIAQGMRWLWKRARPSASRDASPALRQAAMLAAACLAGILLYREHPLTTRVDFQQPEMTLYHQYHQVRMPMYEWILENTPPDAVFLCFEDSIAMTVVMPAARKLLFPMMIYSNLYVDPNELSYNKFRLLDAMDRADREAFRAEAQKHPQVLMLLRREDLANPPRSPEPFFAEVYRAGGLVAFQAKL